ncbi:MAG: sugar transferase [Clostridia bacterium]|nr:sugar transferase [Clostridia bacterium]
MKRVLDILASLSAIIVLSPVFLAVVLIVLISDGSPAIYTQKRVGKDAKLFTIYKFRTMKNGTRLAATNDLTESDSSMISCGSFLRKTSLDELPQLINILKGDMSFVGPRPLIPEEEEIHKLRKENDIYCVRPGLTGYAQVNGRDKCSIEEKVQLDREYIEKKSILFDTKIFFKTFINVFKMSDVVEGGNK